jgi:hypothetical protein
MKLFDHNHNIYGTNKRKSHHYNSTANHHYNMLDDICEFQVKIDFSAMPIKAPASKICRAVFRILILWVDLIVGAEF